MGGGGGAATTAGCGKWACALPPVPRPSTAVVRTTSLGAAWSHALVRMGHVGRPVAVACVGAASRSFEVWLASPKPPLQPPAKRPCVSPAAVVMGRRLRPDSRTPSPLAQHGRVQRTRPCERLNTAPSLDPTGTSVGGEGAPGRGGEQHWLGVARARPGEMWGHPPEPRAAVHNGGQRHLPSHACGGGGFVGGPHHSFVGDEALPGQSRRPCANFSRKGGGGVSGGAR